MSSSFPMEGLTPLIADRFLNTYIAGEDLPSIGLVVEITGDWTVKRCNTMNSTKVVGLNLTIAKNGQKVTVVARGIARAIAYGNITAGDHVVSASAGSGIGMIQTDNVSKNATVLGQAIASAVSGGTAIITLW